MAIKYEAYNWSGQKIKCVVETDSEEDAYQFLQQEELIPYRLSRVRKRLSLVRLAPALFQPKPQDIIDFSRQMSSLLSSGIPPCRTLMVQEEQARNLSLKVALQQVIEDVEAGGRFSDAIARHPTVFADFYVRLLRVGEATGGIALTQRQLAENLERRKAVRDRVKRALTYKAISLAVAGVAAFVLVTYSLPSLVGMLEEFGGQLPAITQLLITIADFLENYGGYTLASAAGFGVAVFVYLRTPHGVMVRDQLLLRMPVIGGIVRSSNMFFLTTTLVTLLEAGVPPIEALRLSRQGLGNSIMQESLAQVTRETSEGTRMGEAFGRQAIFPSLLSQAIVVGEMRGSLGETLRGLANYYEQQTDRSVSGVMELIQPAVILLVAGVVGFVAIAVIAGIYSTLSAVK